MLGGVPRSLLLRTYLPGLCYPVPVGEFIEASGILSFLLLFHIPIFHILPSQDGRNHLALRLLPEIQHITPDIGGNTL